MQFVEGLHRGLPATAIYKTIRKIKGKQQYRVYILKDNNQTYAKIPAIREKLAESFSEVPKDNNYSREFMQYESTVKQQTCDCDSDNSESYNKHSLAHTHNTAPGNDCIYYQMLKNMLQHAKEYLCRIFNQLWQQSHFPTQWQSAIIIPIHKPGKNHSDSKNYRPIALTSCICKLFERMINARLMEYLEMNKCLSNIQCGCRKERSPIDHLVRMENEVRKAFALNEHVISIYFDLEKAYDTTWRVGILRDLRAAGLRGYLPKFIEQFLKRRTFNVRVQNTYSSTYQQRNGVPQGSVLAVTLFALKINSITNCIPQDQRLLSSLYVDDLQISYRHSDLRIIETTLQQCLGKIHEWTKKNGFRFSVSKTNAVHYTSLPGLHNSPVLRMGETIIPYTDKIKFLGLIWDVKLTWKEHIAKLRSECSKLTGLLKMISNQQWGSDQYCTTKVYQIYIRSKLDYGAPVYSSAAKSTLNQLDAITTESMRIATGAFRTTPIETLYVLANELKPQDRRDYLALRYFYKIKGNISNPAHPYLIPVTYRTLFRNKKIPLPLSLRIQDMLEKYKLRKQFIKPQFSYNILHINTPTWTISPPIVNLRLNEYSKVITPPARYKQHYNMLMQTRYNNYTKLYTDGSKRKEGVGAAVVWDNGSRVASLPQEASIFSAEAHAVSMALKVIEEIDGQRFVIISDSKSVLKTMQNIRNNHPLCRKMIHDIHQLHNRANKNVEMCWVPSHIGIPGNEKADEAAVTAARRSEEYITVYYKDWYPVIRRAVLEKWNGEWQTTDQKLKEIKQRVGPWRPRERRSRREEVVVNRLRAGHCLLTHGYLMENNGPQIPPICGFCNDAILTVKHLLIECPNLNQERRRIDVCRRNNTVTMAMLLGDSGPVRDVLKMLQRIGLYNRM